ncbi:MAG: GNAT family N-acetyltransferase [Dehalococcoidia bacterium]|nr:MAG: GNAT family N-acetyltransferase [Dehalococcoidia bacterium]
MTTTEESFASLDSYCSETRYNLRWSSVFVLPGWLRVWWQSFGDGAELYLRTVRQEEEIIGIAPLFIRDKKAALIGSADVCDYLDFVPAHDKEEEFFSVLLDDLIDRGVSHLDLRPLRPNSTVLNYLVATARNRNYSVLCQEDGVSVELDLPATWEEYLALLATKQRHELKRKLRRLEEAGNVAYRCMEVSPPQVDGFMDTFLRLFTLSWEEKAEFMTPRRESFFRSLARAMAEAKLLRLGVLELDAVTVAMIMGFDYDDTMYLYNSAYDPDYRRLSVGLLSKVLCLKDSLEGGKKRFDFLKGGEPYKYQLGGSEIPLYRCEIRIK